ncbi:MAG: response regulator transcription factor [Alistipes sp.]|nr:response regulator transcription factor [Alistipes sp.]
MLKCLAIDDEPLALRQIEKYIEKVPYLELVAASNNPLEAQRIAAIQPIDLMFVDINMPDLNGVDFVRSLITRPMIIFTTAYSEYAVEGFRLDAVDYLLKPFSFADFSRAAAKAYALYELKYGQNATSQPPIATPTPDSVAPVTPTQPTPTPSDDKEFISVKADYKVSLLRTSEILYIESEGEYVRIHLADGSKITTLYRIKNMEASLPSEQFMRVHRSYIVNLGRIRSYVRGRIYLDEKLFVPIGENYKEAFQQYIERTYKNL